jgi:hypothetical protein
MVMNATLNIGITNASLKKTIMPQATLNINVRLFNSDQICRNPSLGFMTKAGACKGVGQKGSPEVTFHALGSVGECEGMNPHTPK